MESVIVDETHLLTEAQLKIVEDLLEFGGDYLKIEADTEVSVTFMDNPAIQEINRDYRNVDRATDVISFALEEEGEGEIPVQFLEEDEKFPRNLGDILISVDKIKEQAQDYGHSFERELGFLVIHGFLHLNGYDHMTPEEEKEMFDIQRRILDAYGLKR